MTIVNGVVKVKSNMSNLTQPILKAVNIVTGNPLESFINVSNSTNYLNYEYWKTK